MELVFCFPEESVTTETGVLTCQVKLADLYRGRVNIARGNLPLHKKLNMNTDCCHICYQSIKGLRIQRYSVRCR